VGACVVPAATHENRACELMLMHLSRQGVAGHLELILVSRGHRGNCPARLAAAMTSTCAGSG
jgi:hypothetical protein